MILGPILGDEKCAHSELIYCSSAYTGNYAVCKDCGGHLWGNTEEGLEIPPGVQVVDLDTWDDEPDDEEDDEPDDDNPQFPIATQARLEAWKKAVEDWKRK